MLATLCRYALYLTTIFVIAATSGSSISARSGHATTALISTLTSPRPSVDGKHVVVSLEAKGDLKGIITIELDPDGAGGLKGKWAMAIAYTQSLNPDGTPAADTPEEHHEEDVIADPEHHRERIRFVNDGTMNGSVTSATLRYAQDGSVIGIDSVLLKVDDGSVTYTGAKGYGEIVTSNDDATTLSITLQEGAR